MMSRDVGLGQYSCGAWPGLPCSPRRSSRRSGNRTTCPGRRNRACRPAEEAAATGSWAPSPPSWCSESPRLRRGGRDGKARDQLPLGGFVFETMMKVNTQQTDWGGSCQQTGPRFTPHADPLLGPKRSSKADNFKRKGRGNVG